MKKIGECLLVKILLYEPRIVIKKKSIIFRCSLYLVKDLKTDDMLIKDNLRVIRSALGLAAKYLDVVTGKFAVKDIKIRTVFTWGLIK
jgi:sialic acid synthase SpsE